MHNIRIKIIRNVDEAVVELKKIGCDPYGVDVMSLKSVHRCVKLECVDSKIANILKQEMLSIGGDAAVSRGVIDFTVKTTDVLLMGTIRHYRELAEKLKTQPFKLSNLGEEINKILGNFRGAKKTIKCGKYELKFGEKTLVMGILNTAPDSFYDGGRYVNLDSAVEHAVKMESDGADIIDVGGESSRPGSEPVSLEVELARVIPVIKEISDKVKIPISIDTVKEKVARKALEAGASIINDISGLRFDSEMAETASEYNVPVVIMHMKGTPKSMQDNPEYNSVMGEIIYFLRKQADFAVNSGIDPDNIIVDPGIGFGKKLEHNLEIIKNLGELKTLGFPILAGPSRKSFIGNILNLPPEERLEGTISAASITAINGADILRVHDVKETKRALKISDAVKYL